MLKDVDKVYEDELLVGFLSPQPAAEGHIILTTKEHYPIFENVPDEIVAKLGVIANTLSIRLFERLGATGTNLLINNGGPAGQTEPHFLLHIIPRTEGDGIDLAWQPKKSSAEELEGIAHQIESSQNAPEPIQEPVEPVSEESDKENYLLKSLTRIP